MRFSVRELFADLSGRAEGDLVGLLLAQADAALAGAELVRGVVVAGKPTEAGLREEIRAIEHEGDDIREQVVLTLSSALVVPLDREDLFRFSGGVDDVLDNLRDFAREWDLYRMEPSAFFGPVLDEIIEGMAELRAAAAFIADDRSAIPIGALRAKKAGNLIRRNYQRSMAELFDRAGDAPVGVDVLKHRELLRRLDIVGLRIRETAELLADAAVKRSH